MNRFLLLGLLSLFCIALQGQNEVVIDGVTFSADRKTLISYPRDKADQEYVVPGGTEIIGKSAFEYVIVRKVVLPSTLKKIDDFAFINCWRLETVVWKNFPEIGNSIFWNANTTFEVSDDNKECILIGNALFSKDRKCLLLHSPENTESAYEYGEYVVPDGTEIIAERAFDGVKLSKVFLPSSLRRIEDLAFRVKRGVPVRSPNYDNYYLYLESLVCESPIPPTLVGNPFFDPKEIVLRVPRDYMETYRNTPGWKEFKGIYGLSVKKQSVKTTKVWLNDCTLSLTCEQHVLKIQLYNPIGVLLNDYTVNGLFYSVNIDNLQKGVLLVKVIYNDATEDIFKLCK